MKVLKKFFMVIGLSISLSLGLIAQTTPKAEAFVTAPYWGVPAVMITASILGGVGVLGLTTMATGYIVDGRSCLKNCMQTPGERFRSLTAKVGISSIILGIFFLETKNKWQFAELTEKEGKKIGVSEEFRTTYNDEVEEINAVTQSIFKNNLAKIAMKKKSSQSLREQANEIRQQFLSQLKLANVSPETIEVMKALQKFNDASVEKSMQ